MRSAAKAYSVVSSPLARALRWRPGRQASPVRVQDPDRQVRALHMRVVPQAGQRDHGDAQPDKLLVGIHCALPIAPPQATGRQQASGCRAAT